jgi:tRNA(fMet)-specific endonuclease VapC
LVDAERGGDSLEEVIDDGDDVAVAAITVAELRVGVQLAHADLLAYVRRTETPRGAHDLIIAATARAQERQVVSADQSGFAGLPGVSLASDFG